MLSGFSLSVADFGPILPTKVQQMLYCNRPCCSAIETETPWVPSSHASTRTASTGCHAQFIVKRRGKIALRETRTFNRRRAAAALLEKRETELAKPDVLDWMKAPDRSRGWGR